MPSKKAIKKTTLEKATAKFADEATKPFTLEQAEKQIQPMIRKLPADLSVALYKELSKSHMLFYDETDGRYIPRNHYFHKARFLISPQAQELEFGILIPGHRFLPFCFSEVFPADCRLIKEDGKTIRRKQFRFPFEELIIYHSLLGRGHMINYFITDDERNGDFFLQNDPMASELYLTVFNMKKFYHDHNFQQGDYLLLTVESWKEGIFSVKYLAKEKSAKSSEVNKWRKLLENKLIESFSQLGTLTNIHEQLSLAFYLGGNSLISKPALHIGGFLAKSKKVEITHLGMYTILWHYGQKPEEIYENLESIIELDTMSGNMESLDGILSDIGFPITKDEIEAYMRDELHSGGKNLEKVKKRCFGNEELCFFNKKQEKEFYRLLNKLWNKISKSYNIFTDKKSGELRKRVLEIMESNNKWLYKLDDAGALPQDFPQQEIMTLTQGMAMLRQIIEELNCGDDPDEKFQGNISHIVEEVALSVKTLRENIEMRLSQGNQLLQIVADGKKTKKEVEVQIYQLKISLLYIRPKIWRRVLVPNNITLEDLHNIIQGAMGWEDYHLHSFNIGGREYGPDTVYGDPIGIDEAAVYLEDLIKKTREKFYYVYDFGDSWEHEVILEKILSPQKGKTYPICIDGKMACPPEDCGGIPGYQVMLEAIANSEHPEHEEMLDWLGGYFDPTAFSTEETISRMDTKWPKK